MVAYLDQQMNYLSILPQYVDIHSPTALEEDNASCKPVGLIKCPKKEQWLVGHGQYGKC